MRQKRMKLPMLLLAVILPMLIGCSGGMCLRDAFSVTAKPWVLPAVCGAVAAAAAATAVLRRHLAVDLLVLAACAGVLLWQRREVMDSLSYLFRCITEEYALAFADFPVIGIESGEGSWALAIFAALLAWSAAWVITREGSVILVVLAALPVLLLTLLVVDLAPVLWLVLLTGGLLILLLSQNVRERSAAEGGRLAWWLVLPTVILICAITTLWPPADYVRADWSDALQKMAETRTGVEEWRETVVAVRPRWNRELKTVDLSRVGPKVLTGIPVLDYRAEEEISYLRGLSLAVYDGNRWQAAEASAYDGGPMAQTTPVERQYTLEIRTRSADPRMYTTYDPAVVPAGGSPVDDAYIRNSGSHLEYTVRFGPGQTAAPTAAQAQALQLLYTGLPEELQAPLQQILQENDLTEASAEAIASYVRGLGRYELDTPAVPAGRDFALYFLQESQQGYCIHFATATVLLLRAAGIPSRYVTGYAVSGPAGQWNTVTQDEAHAWVEYYTEAAGWQPLEPTPAAADSPVPAEPSRTEPTAEDPPPEPDAPAPAAPDTPAHTAETAPPQKAAPKGGRLLLWLLPGLPTGMVLRRWIILRCRRSRCRKGNPNRRAMAWWRWLEQLYRASGETVPEELLCLAEKARFSQHTLTEEELYRFRQASESRIAALRLLPPGRRLWLQVGPVLF